QIRELAAEGRSVEEITDEVGALGEKQVKRVIDGQTYRRVHKFFYSFLAPSSIWVSRGGQHSPFEQIL
ncbi:MAG: hypothetical protein RLN85_10640, partial [Pseudomonadales bacterium]